MMQTAIVAVIICAACIWLVWLLAQRIRRAKSGEGCGCCSARGSCGRVSGAGKKGGDGDCQERDEGGESRG